FGMQYAAAGRASPDGTINALSAGPEKRALKRLAVYGRPTNVVTGSEALKHRELKPHRVAHCLPLFVGSETVNRKITNRLCPPEALMGLILRRIANNAIDSQPQPGIVAITVPSMYNQFHRRSILQAAKLAGFESVRLVHRSVAAAQFQLLTEHALHQHDRDDDVVALDDPKDTAGGATDSADDSSHHKLVVCITGMGTEISVVHATTNRVTQLSAVGNVHGGTLRWTQSLVDFVAKSVSKEFSVDLRADTGDAIHLQIACEKAMAQLMIGEQTTLRLQSKTHGDRMRLMISRKDLLECGEGLLVHLNEMIARAVKDAGIKMSDIKQCLTVGMTIRIPEVSQRLLSQLPADVELIPIERNELAVGAASCVVAEFPDRQGLPLPPQPCMGMAIGLLAKNADGQRRIQELITKGSELPAHVNRRLTSEKDGKSPTLRIVESHGWRKTQWTQIGQHQLPALDGSQTLETSIDADINGMLVLRCRRADGAEVTQLPVLNTSPLPDDSLATWAAWVKKYA
ncbi:MAG: Hsp70 family protein, partial [Planctomycetota bacterium]